MKQCEIHDVQGIDGRNEVTERGGASAEGNFIEVASDVEPHRLILKGKQWYLQTYCLEKKQRRASCKYI